MKRFPSSGAVVPVVAGLTSDDGGAVLGRQRLAQSGPFVEILDSYFISWNVHLRH